MRDYFFIYEVKEGEGYHIKVNHSDLLYVQAKGDYVNIVTRQTHYVVHETLKDFTERVGEILYRNHRSYSVNVQNIDIVNKNDIFVGKYEIPIGEPYKKDLINLLYENG